MTSPPAPSSNTWWRRLSLAPPDDVCSDHFRALRQRGFSRQEAHEALLEANNDLDAAFHIAIRIRHKSHTGSPLLYSGCELCEQEKERLQARRASIQARRECLASPNAILARKAEAVEQWRERQARMTSPTFSDKASAEGKGNEPESERRRKCSGNLHGQHVRWGYCPPHEPTANEAL